MDALAGLDVEGAATAHQLLDLVGPHAGCVHDDLGAYLDLAPGLEVDGAHRERVVDAEGTTAREVRLSAGLAPEHE